MAGLMRRAMALFLVVGPIFFFTTPFSVDHCIQKAIDTWTITDLTRAIAAQDRPYMYQNLIKSHLDLYASLYWCVEQAKNVTVTPRVQQEVEELLHAIHTTSQDLFASPQTKEESFVGMIMQQTVDAWDRLKMPGHINADQAAFHSRQKHVSSANNLL